MSPWLAYLLVFFLFLAGAFLSFVFMQPLAKGGRIDDKAQALRKVLPGHDCGLCGAATCLAYAVSLAQGAMEVGRCRPGAHAIESRLRSILEDPGDQAEIAIIRCGATKQDSPDLYDYSGIEDCAAARAIYDGPRLCRDACLGYGSCVSHCPVGAIGKSTGQLAIDPDLCMGCGACIAACPTGVIALVPADDDLFVACNSRLGVAQRMGICSAACNGCHSCERPDGAPSFVVKKGLATRSEWKIADRAYFMRSCPTGVIRDPRHVQKSGGHS